MKDKVFILNQFSSFQFCEGSFQRRNRLRDEVLTVMVFASRTCTLKELTVWWSLIACSRLELLNGLIPNLITMNCPYQEQSER